MEIAYLYSKARTEFGKAVRLDDAPAELIAPLPAVDMQHDGEPVVRNPSIGVFDCSPSWSTSEVNTERLEVATTAMLHQEGGWPKEVDSRDKQEVARWRAKEMKSARYVQSVRALGPRILQCMKQNKTLDIYEEYFAENVTDHSKVPSNVNQLAVLRDPCGLPLAAGSSGGSKTSACVRTACSLSWHPDGPSRVAVAYNLPKFQDPRLEDPALPRQSYLWDILNPNVPLATLVGPYLLNCVAFHPKQPDAMLLSGCANGLVCLFDIRASGGGSPSGGGTQSSTVEDSHREAVTSVAWTSSKAQMSAVSCSTDGALLFWDVRKLGVPVDQIMLATPAASSSPSQTSSSNSGGVKEGGWVGACGGAVLGASSMHYDAAAGASKVLLGSEQGVPMLVNLKNRRANNGVTFFDGGGRHFGPIAATHRHPVHDKFFLTVGDWSAKIWTEDLHAPTFTTRYHEAYLTCGCWSPTRAAVFLVGRADGSLDVWDLLQRTTDPVVTHSVNAAGGTASSADNNNGDDNNNNSGSSSSGNRPGLTALAVSSPGGKLLCTGDAGGNVCLLELSTNLAHSAAGEKLAVGNLLEREFQQEKNLEAREKEIARVQVSEEQAAAKAEANAVSSSAESSTSSNKAADRALAALLRKVDTDFMQMMREESEG